MKWYIREAVFDDYQSLLPLFLQVHDLHVNERPDLYKENETPVELDFYRKFLDESKYYVFVVVWDEKIVAFAVTEIEEVKDNPFMKDRRTLYINSLCVHEELRNKGIGQSLMQHLIDFGKTLGVQSLELGVSERNQQAILFYESIGLQTKNRRMEVIL